MQMVAGGEQGQPDRSRNSSWMEAGLQKERKGRRSGWSRKLRAREDSSEEIL